ncbi:hypothetical protein N7526_001877 [Penicillium atrosanguineum]|nr:hypothetical protein N7526_001877 [Penicillium atrosanguineum]
MQIAALVVISRRIFILFFAKLIEAFVVGEFLLNLDYVSFSCKQPSMLLRLVVQWKDNRYEYCTVSLTMKRSGPTGFPLPSSGLRCPGSSLARFPHLSLRGGMCGTVDGHESP